jgi:exodeoxyribonuclease VII large subunit
MTTQTGLKLLTVTELTNFIKDTLESMVGRVRVLGEISGLHTSGPGHAYFTLKDEGATLNCVMFRNVAAKIAILLKDGLKVEATGEVTVYSSRGQYQLVIENLIEAGIGELFQRFEALKKKLATEGLFDAARKKPIPFLPLRIGVITSPTGAAVRDIINILTRRFPHLHIILYPTLVQGKESAGEIARAIRRMNELNLVDVLIVGRGGGSLEDLWAFNEEEVARAIFASRLPIISAVGHETDFTIADFVADLRAPTPSAAAELVTQNHQRLMEILSDIDGRLERAIEHYIEVWRLRLKQLATSHILHSPVNRLQQYQQRLDEILERLRLYSRTLIEHARRQFALIMARLDALSPEAVLARGYSIVTKPETGEVVKNAQQVNESEQLDVRLHKGNLGVIVEKRELNNQ